MDDIINLAYSYWRMLHDDNPEKKANLNPDSVVAVKNYLDQKNIEIIDLSGEKYKPGIAVKVVNVGFFKDITNKDDIYIVKTIKPIILKNGEVIESGVVALGTMEILSALKGENNTMDNNKEKIKERIKLKDPNNLNENDKSIVEDIINENEMKNTENSSEMKNGYNIIIKKEVGPFTAFISVLLLISLFINAILICRFKNEIQNELFEDVATTTEAIDYEDLYTTTKTTENTTKERETLKESVTRVSEAETTVTEQSEKEIEADTAETEIPSDINWKEYFVKEGDTLYGICLDEGIDYSEYYKYIIEKNNLYSDGSIYYDTTILLPVV